MHTSCCEVVSLLLHLSPECIGNHFNLPVIVLFLSNALENRAEPNENMSKYLLTALYVIQVDICLQ